MTNTMGADIAALIRAVAWLAGEWLGIRRRHYGSPLAGRLFPRTPLRRLDTSRGWGVPTVADDHERRGRSLWPDWQRRICAAK
jgi:hypothetical protein